MPRMKITIRERPVRAKLVSRSLSQIERDIYRPSWLRTPIKIIFGFNYDMLEDYGMMLYHKNRLIKAYEKVGYQKQENELGVGVVGVAEVDFLEPIHNKQDFKIDEKYISVVKAFGDKLNDYWNEKIEGQKSQTAQKKNEVPDLWVQCDSCLKWRRLPGQTTKKSLPLKWFCFLNRDSAHNRCDIPQEEEGDDEEVLKPSYKKTFKRKQKEKIQREKKNFQDILMQASQSKEQSNESRSSRSSLKRSPEKTTATQSTDNSDSNDSNDDSQSVPSKKPHLEQPEQPSSYKAFLLQLAPSFLKKKQDNIREIENNASSHTLINHENNDCDLHEQSPSSTSQLGRTDLIRDRKTTPRKAQIKEADSYGKVGIKLELADETTPSSMQSNTPSSGSKLLEMMREELKLRKKELEDTKERFKKFRCNVQNLLGFMAPNDNVKEVNDIEILVENLIKKYQESVKEEDNFEEEKPVIHFKYPLADVQGSNSSSKKIKPKDTEKQCCIS